MKQIRVDHARGNRRHSRRIIEAQIIGNTCTVYNDILAQRQWEEHRRIVIEALDHINDLNKEHHQRVRSFIDSLPLGVQVELQDEMYYWDK